MKNWLPRSAALSLTNADGFLSVSSRSGPRCEACNASSGADNTSVLRRLVAVSSTKQALSCVQRGADMPPAGMVRSMVRTLSEELSATVHVAITISISVSKVIARRKMRLRVWL